MTKFSLEHIIRNIASGNFTPSDEPKINLEHAIKKVVRGESSYAAKDSKPIDEKKKEVLPDEEDNKLAGSDDKMDEAVGSMGTDKFQGSQFKSVRSSTPHIKPPGPEHGHSQAPENVSRQRTIAKEKSSMTMHGKVNESTNNIEENSQIDELSDVLLNRYREKARKDVKRLGDKGAILASRKIHGETKDIKTQKGPGKGLSAPKVRATTTYTGKKTYGKNYEKHLNAATMYDNWLRDSKVKKEETEIEESSKTKTAEKIFDILRGTLKVQDKVSNLPALVGSKEVSTSKPSLPAEIETQKTSVPVGKVPETPPAVAPKMPTPEVKPETKTEIKPEVKTDTKTVVKPQEPTATPTTATSPEMATPSQVKTQVVPKAPPAPATKTGTSAKAPTPPKTPVPPKTPPKETLPEVPAGFALGLPRGTPHDMQYHVLHHVPVKRHVSFAKPHMKEETETDRKKIEFVPRNDAGDRKKLEYVGRPKTKQETLGRNAATKTNVIDEAKKLTSVVKKAVKEKTKAESGGLGDGKTKVYDNPPVVINPNLNRIDMNVAEGALTSPATLNVASELPGIYNLIKKGEYKKAINAAGAATVGGLLTKTPGIGTALSAMEPTPANDGENEFARQKEFSKVQTPPPLSSKPGIQLDRNPRNKPLAPGEPIKLK